MLVERQRAVARCQHAVAVETARRGRRFPTLRVLDDYQSPHVEQRAGRTGCLLQAAQIIWRIEQHQISADLFARGAYSE